MHVVPAAVAVPVVVEAEEGIEAAVETVVVGAVKKRSGPET